MSVSDVSHSTSSSAATSTEVLPRFIVTGDCPTILEGPNINNYQFLSQVKIREVVNSFTNSSNTNVRNIWEACKEKLETQGYTMAFIQSQSYAFKSEDTIRAMLDGNNRIYIGIPSTESEGNIVRLVFNGQTLTTSSDIAPNNITKETHKLAHVVSFLSSGIASSQDWDARKQDWAKFFKESRMEPIYIALQNENRSIDEIHDSFKKLFTNTEEARNLLGVIPGKNEGEYIGEFYFFNEHNNYELLTYLDHNVALTDCDKAVLNAIAVGFSITFQPSGCCSRSECCLLL
ncbi:MAG: hypothetical protein LBB19_04290 [Puniceicoccales bacterium]|nr:hypothetical protein [Puniceicoccales bacterium]